MQDFNKKYTLIMQGCMLAKDITVHISHDAMACLWPGCKVRPSEAVNEEPLEEHGASSSLLLSVGGLAEDVTAQQLQDTFQAYGEIFVSWGCIPAIKGKPD